MTSRVIPVAPFALAVFGATGDLAMRKLFPALWRRVQAGQAPAESKIIGIARAEIDRDEFRRGVADNLKKASAIDDESDPRLRDFLAASIMSPSTPKARTAGIRSPPLSMARRARHCFISPSPRRSPRPFAAACAKTDFSPTATRASCSKNRLAAICKARAN